VSPERVTFSATFDTATLVTSGIACAALTAISFFTHSTITSILVAAVIAISYLYSPREYVIEGAALLIRRWAGTVRIPLVSIRQLRAAGRDDFRGTVRLWGSGGMFGYYGTFRTTRLGKCTWYMTQRRQAVVLATAGRTVLVSPDDIPGFLAAVRRVAPVEESAALPPPIAAGRSGPPVSAWIAASLGLIVIIVLAVAFNYSPGPPAVQLAGDSLRIEDRFYPVTVRANEVDAASIRVVNIRTNPQWKPVMRTNGFANSHYRSGWFRTAAGDKARMYWADSTDLVLLPPKAGGDPVLLEVRNPEQFAARLRETWASR
jgi:hypothetical protein